MDYVPSMDHGIIVIPSQSQYLLDSHWAEAEAVAGVGALGARPVCGRSETHCRTV